MNQLYVLLDEQEVGRVEQVHARGGEPGLRFTYCRAWLDATAAFAISHSLPLREEPFEQEAKRFFGNLLPEGDARKSVLRNLKISEDNDFALLRALGRDCAGALRIVESREPVASREKPRRVVEEDLERWSRGMGYATETGRDLRLSIAGAQYKLGVVLDGDDLVIPGDESPSTHLLKLPNRDYATLPENEAFVLALARAVGLEVPDSRLHPGKGARLLLVTRYDRAGSPIRRLHQEDLCQALGIDRSSKYEAEGGPSFRQCLDVVRKISSRSLLDQRALFRWAAFCVVVGNRDNHAKNLSLLRDERGRWRLAPFYDLVCTRAYKTLGTALAMSIGGWTKGDNLPRAAWEAEARVLGVTPKYMTEVVAKTVDDVERALPAVRDALATRLGTREPLERPVRAIRGTLRLVKRGL